MSTDLTQTQQMARDKMAAIRLAQIPWAALSVVQRGQQMQAACQNMLSRSEELAVLIAQETKKPLAEAYSAEVLGIGDLFKYWLKKAPVLLQPRKGEIPSLELPGKKAWVERLPRGVIGVISPWNFPVSLPMRSLIPALLAGNGVLLKPSEITPLTGEWLVARLRESLGDIVDVMPGAGEAGAALVEAQPDMVVFTGSTRTGRRVAVACAERGIPCEVELGGKDCAIVLDDADIERSAAGIAWGIVSNAGQNCSGIERVAVASSIAAVFSAALVKALEVTAVSVPDLVTSTQRQIVIGHITDAQARGCTTLTGGLPAGNEQAIPPTLLSNVPRDAPAWADESFGPMAVLEIQNDDASLIAAANARRYGLGASVWTSDLERGKRVASQVRSGMVWINNHSFSAAVPDLPWVGIGDSGTGVTNSPDALLHMTRPHLIVVDSTKAIEPWWYPYGPKMLDLMRILVPRQQTGGIAATFKTLGALKKRNAELNGK